MTPAESFATQLRDQRTWLLDTWMGRVRRSVQVPSSDGVDPTQLRDHVPLLLDDLAKYVRAAPWSALDPDTDSDAGAHGYFRWHQGYDLAEVLHELSLLRAVILELLVGQADADLDLHHRTHRFLDDVVRISTLRFAEQQQASIETISASRLALLQTVSHEVRNAVNSIHLVREVQRRVAVQAPQAPLQETLDRTVLHLRTLLDNLLDFTRLSEGHVVLEWEPIDLRRLAEELEDTFRESAEDAGLAFVVDVDPALQGVDTDLTSLRQVSGNFLSNALKYTETGTVTLRMVDFDEHNWRLEVTDTGIGIGPDGQARFIEALHGSVQVTSELGGGSTFAALLPKRRPATST